MKALSPLNVPSHTQPWVNFNNSFVMSFSDCNQYLIVDRYPTEAALSASGGTAVANALISGHYTAWTSTGLDQWIKVGTEHGYVPALIDNGGT